MKYFTDIELQPNARLLGADYRDLSNTPIGEYIGTADEPVILFHLPIGVALVQGVIQPNSDADAETWEQRLVRVQEREHDGKSIAFEQLNESDETADTAQTTIAAYLFDGDGTYIYLPNTIAGEGGVTECMIATTWEELITWRNEGKLIAGCWYRITDYECTADGSEEYKAVSHPFDIVVLATDTNTLSETARAIKHEGDTYYDLCHLNAWELKYCIDNDTNRFKWADANNGKGVVYYMKDDRGNEIPYDFHGIQFKRYKSNYGDFAGKYVCTLNSPSVLQRQSDYMWCFTFSQVSGTTSSDASVLGWSRLYSNTMGEYFNNETQCLNNNVFTYLTDYGYCYCNTFGNYCYYNTFGNYCYYNTFGNYCGGNTFGNNCNFNTFWNYCDYNTFGNNCNYNTFGNFCDNNTFGSYSNNNTFGESCNYNTFGNACYYNTFGNSCHSNTFGNACHYNHLGNTSSNNTTPSYFRFCTFGDNVQYTRLQGSGTSTDYVGNVQIVKDTQGTSSSPKVITIARVPESQLATKETDIVLQDGSVVKISQYAKLQSPEFEGTPTAPTATAGTNTTQIATTAFVQTAIDSVLGASDAMVYKGTIGAASDNPTYTELPSSVAEAGWTLKVITAGSYVSEHTCTIGDLLICLTDGSSTTPATWTCVAVNPDGTVMSEETASIDGKIAVFSGTSGSRIKMSSQSVSDLATANHTHSQYSAVGHTHTASEIGDLANYIIDGGTY